MIYPAFDDPFLVRQTAILLQSYRHWTGKLLLTESKDGDETVSLLFNADFALISHGTELDPVLNYGNRKALELWEMSWKEFIKMPSRLTAEPVHREERARLLARVTEKGWMGGYRGIRTTKTGRRFQIENAVIWSLLDARGELAGQAAMFRNWFFLEQ